MLHRLCGPPSIPLSFNLAAVLPRRSAGTLRLAPMLNTTKRDVDDAIELLDRSFQEVKCR